MKQKRFRRLDIERAIVGDQVRHHGAIVTILGITASPDGYHFRVELSDRPGRTNYYPCGAVFTQPPLP